MRSLRGFHFIARRIPEHWRQRPARSSGEWQTLSPTPAWKLPARPWRKLPNDNNSPQRGFMFFASNVERTQRLATIPYLKSGHFSAISPSGWLVRTTWAPLAHVPWLRRQLRVHELFPQTLNGRTSVLDIALDDTPRMWFTNDKIATPRPQCSTWDYRERRPAM